ncbi:hypothetical protein ACFSFY_13315 [Sporosarcina siberiensis]|uniref:VanZ like family protein n=1 Tax=Sporosarcina siberiensis TaxID=1365606 RepID=A0ABW4SIS4_9BACL
MKRFLYYFSWTIVVSFIIYLGAKYQMWLQLEASKNFELSSLYLYSTIFPIVIGMMLRLPKLLTEIRQNSQWTFDWVKFIGIGLPSFCILSMYVLPFYLPESMLSLIPNAIMFRNQTIQVVAGVVLGFILLDSVKK